MTVGDVWRKKTDEEIEEARANLDEYTKNAQRIIVWISKCLLCIGDK